eukprot:5768756-Prymnesium_polylepis.1
MCIRDSVTTSRDWRQWLDVMARLPIALLTMDAINSLLPRMLEHAFPGHVVSQRTPIGRWGHGFGVGAANTSFWRRAPLKPRVIPLPNATERQEILRLNALDGQLYALALNHTTAFRAHLAGVAGAWTTTARQRRR